MRVRWCYSNAVFSFAEEALTVALGKHSEACGRTSAKEAGVKEVMLTEVR